MARGIFGKKWMERFGWLAWLSLAAACAVTSPASDIRELDARADLAPRGDIAERQDTAPDHTGLDGPSVLADSVALDLPMDELLTPIDMTELHASDTPLEGTLGSVAGTCDDLAEILANGEAVFTQNSYQFESLLFDVDLLNEGAQKRYEMDNVGGSSLCSEVMSIQLLEECAGAELYKTESEVDYTTPGDMTDYIIDVAGLRVGVSVTRAYKGPMGDTYTLEDATTLLTKKLAGLDAASINVVPLDGFTRKLLHIWTLRADWVPVVESAYFSLPEALRSDIIVLITVEENSTWVVPEACK